MSNLRVGMRDDASVPSHPTSMNSFPTLSISCDPQNALVQRFASCALCGCRAVRLLCVHSSSCNTTLSVGGGGGNKELSLQKQGQDKKDVHNKKKMIFFFAIRFTWPMEEIQFLNGYVRWDLIVHINMYVDRAANKLNLSLRRTVYSIV